MKKHEADKVEYIDVFIDENQHPTTFNAKLKELIGSGMSEHEARTFISVTPFQMELYYSEGCGLFMVETEAVDNTDIINPYTGEILEEEEE